jgi:hypothetical membrane protein
MLDRLRWAGPAAVGWSAAVVATAASVNPQFSWLHGALSELGAPGATAPWVYDGGLVVAGALIVLYSLYLAAAARHWVEAYGAACFGLAGVFLALVGVYHAGTYPHDFVSEWFFTQAALGAAVWGVGELLTGRWRGAGYVALAVGAEAAAAIVPWPSVALVESFGALAVCAFALLVFGEERRLGPPRGRRPEPHAVGPSVPPERA